jgi:hypothetical protein
MNGDFTKRVFQEIVYVFDSSTDAEKAQTLFEATRNEPKDFEDYLTYAAINWSIDWTATQKLNRAKE